jgi:hypothetical protein
MFDWEKIVKSQSALLVIIAFYIVGCKKPYDPPVINSPNSYLVVDGVINNGPDSTIIKLSRTVNLSSKTIFNPVTGGTLAVESDQNTVYPLQELGGGRYGIAGLNLDSTRKYRLRIQASGEQYLSDLVPVVNAPPMDTLGFDIQSNGIQLNVSTHDPKNNTHYYRWDFQETWIFHSNYLSGYVSNGDTVIGRNFVTNEIYQCWGNDTSSTVILGSSARLSKDVISNQPLTFVSSSSEKLGTKYSILVKQYGLTGDAYTFWKNLKSSSEQLGGIFDPQPTQINGNIHSVTNPREPVIGYVSAGRVTSKRIFISDAQLPGWVPAPVYPNCILDSLYLYYKPPGATVGVNQENLYFNVNRGANPRDALIPVQAIIIRTIVGIKIIGHSGSTPECVDCTLRGTNKQPAFWK